jgi:hypothetical protein
MVTFPGSTLSDSVTEALLKAHHAHLRVRRFRVWQSLSQAAVSLTLSRPRVCQAVHSLPGKMP